MGDDLQARLESHSRVFEGLMSLIPADYYYGKDNSDQWQKQKQTKEQKREAKKAKLNPGAYKSALDVHLENDLKRKRAAEGQSEDDGGEEQEQEVPREGLKGKGNKKQKLVAEVKATVAVAAQPKSEDEIRGAKAEKRREQRERKKARQNQKSEKKKLDKETKKDNSVPQTAKAVVQSVARGDQVNAADLDEAEVDEEEAVAERVHNEDEDEEDEDEEDDRVDDGDSDEDEIAQAHASDDIDKLDIDGLVDEVTLVDASSSASSSPSHVDPISDESRQPSSTSSTSSIVLPLTKTGDIATTSAIDTVEGGKQANQDVDGANESAAQMPDDAAKHPKLPKIDQEVLQSRLAARIEALRAARKADGPNGKPARNRQELIETRRQKQEQRKALKKELRAKAKGEGNAENEAARLRGGSGSPLWSPAILSPREQENHFSFGRVAFEDGAHMDPTLTNVMDAKKRKGPQDPRTALEAAEKKKSRLSGLDEGRRADIEEKDRWLNMKKRVYGEKIKDDTSLLKKTLKRKEQDKHKSEREWNERIDGVAKGKETRQKKRDDNLQKRKDGKGVGKKGGKPAAKSGAGAAKRPPKRAGFEGSFKSSSRSSKP